MIARAALSTSLACAGCWVTHVAGVIDEGSGDHGASSDAISPTSTASDDDATGSGACELPAPDPSCDAFADPLRSFELACFPGVAAATFQTDDAAAWRRAHEFGNAYFAPRFGDALLVMSTGVLAETDPAGQVAQDPGAAQPGTANANPDGTELPAPIDPRHGSNGGAGGAPFFDCDGVGDCSESLPGPWVAGGGAGDLIWWSAEVAVPDGARRFELDVAWLSAEFPERVGAANDMFVLWVSGESFTGNAATLQGQPMSTTGLAAVLAEHVGDDPMLLRTGMDGVLASSCEVDGQSVPACPIGAASDWLTLTAPVVGGETIAIAGALFDQGGTDLDSIVLLDHFRWGCDPCTPGSDCGLAPS